MWPVTYFLQLGPTFNSTLSYKLCTTQTTAYHLSYIHLYSLASFLMNRGTKKNTDQVYNSVSIHKVNTLMPIMFALGAVENLPCSDIEQQGKLRGIM